jgi:hypothetical protein
MTVPKNAVTGEGDGQILLSLVVLLAARRAFRTDRALGAVLDADADAKLREDFAGGSHRTTSPPPKASP